MQSKFRQMIPVIIAWWVLRNFPTPEPDVSDTDN
jgi:hypothetical protein